MAELSKRLAAIAERIPAGAAVADIGTDHAYLPIFLQSAGRVRRMIACDIHEGPLRTAGRNIAESGLSEVELRLGDGLTPVIPGEVDTVVVAGMGGGVIADIIAAAPWLTEQRTRLILQPMTSAEDLRRYLSRAGFSVEEETAVLDAGRVYCILVAVYDEKREGYTQAEEYIGKLTGNTPAEKRYIEKQYRRLQNEAAEIKLAPQKREDYENLLCVLRDIRQVMEKAGMDTDDSGGRL